MNSDRWQKVKDLFHAALERDVNHRAAFLNGACADDVSLRSEVESLLACDDHETSFLSSLPYDLGATDAEVGAMVGRDVGPYKLLREIGRGGMGAVYLATRADDAYRKQVAIKLVKRGMDTDVIVRRFRMERQILADLDHPHIAKLLDGGNTEDGRSYFVMDHVDGLRIDVYCDTHKLPITERLKLFRDVCSAVQYAHRHHVVHRDLKPSNILVTAERVPKLLDFGIAKVLGPEPSSQTGESTAMLRPMTPEYASPEQVSGKPITPASDIYSLGVMLYILLTGHHPHRIASQPREKVERIVCEEEPERPSTVINRVEPVSTGDGTGPARTPVSVSETREGQPEKLRRRLVGDLDNIVLKAMRKEPERRYASVEQFSEDIRRHLEGLPVTARKDALMYRGTKFLERNKAAAVAVALTAVGVTIVAMAISRFTGRSQIESIAVLPFVNVDADPNTEYLSDGIAETLMNDLSQLPKLKVLSRRVVSPYKGKEQDPQAVGRTLGVQAVVTGRVSHREDDLSVCAELVEVGSNHHLWSDQYTRKFSDVLSLQEEITRKISEQLRLRLNGEKKQRLTRRYAANPEAYQSYLKGRYYRNKTTPEGVKKAIEHFEQAIKLDPRYGLAYAWLGDSFHMSSIFSFLSPQEAFAKAKASALKALELDDTLAEAHEVLGHVYLDYDWDGPAAEREFQRAIALEPDEAAAHQAYGGALTRLGRFDEGIREVQRARELDPVGLEANGGVALNLYFARRYDEAISAARQTLEMDPNYPLAHRVIGMALVEKHLYDQAIAAFQKAIALGDSQILRAELGHVYGLSGQRSEALRILNQLEDLSKVKYVASFHIAIIHMGLGERDRAFEWLERSYAERERWLVNLLTSPIFDPLHSDPRHQDLVRRVGLWR